MPIDAPRVYAPGLIARDHAPDCIEETRLMGKEPERVSPVCMLRRVSPSRWRLGIIGSRRPMR